MSWRNVQRKGGGTSGLAAELLRSLFSGDAGPKKPPRPQWQCVCCQTNNYMNRPICRGCGAGTVAAPPTTPKTHPSKKAPSPVNMKVKPVALAPWATPEMVKAREAQLTIAISAAKASGGCEHVVTKLQEELTGQQKKAATFVPVLTQIESTKGFIGRATKRQVVVDARIAELQAESDQIKQEVTDAEDRLSKLEAEAADLLHLKQPADVNASLDAFKALEDAVRTLMITMHSSRHQLPPQVTEAVDMISTCLPTTRPSNDYVESDVEAGLNGDDDDDLLMEELDEEDSDDKLLEIARRLKAKRLRVN